MNTTYGIPNVIILLVVGGLMIICLGAVLIRFANQRNAGREERLRDLQNKSQLDAIQKRNGHALIKSSSN